MSDKNNKMFSDDILKDLENLKSRYSDYENDEKPIKKPVKSAERPKTESKEIRQKKPAAADAPVKKAAPKKEAPAAKPAPARKPAAANKTAASEKAAPARKPAPAREQSSMNRPAPVKKTAPADNDDLSVFDGLILTDNGSSIYNNEPADTSKAKHKSFEKPFAAKKADKPQKQEKPSDKPENNNKKKGKKKSRKLINTLLIVGIVAILWGAIFGIDLVLVSNWQDPVFCKKTAEYENGSKDFIGAFYKVQYHVEDNGDIYTVCLPWFVKGPNKDLKKADEASDKKDEAPSKAVSAEPEADNSPMEIIIPKEYIEEEITKDTQLTAEQKSKGYISLALNGDGSVTYQIGKADYENEVKNIKSDVERKLMGLVTDNDFPSIKKVDFNEDLSQVSLYVDKAVYQTGLDSFVSQSISTWVGFYQSFAKQSLAFDLSILDYTDGSVIEQSKG